MESEKEVQRYHNWCQHTHKHILDVNLAGDYVLHRDYQALEKKLHAIEAQLKEYVDFTYKAGEHAGELLSSIRSLEAALSLEPENIERVAAAFYEDQFESKQLGDTDSDIRTYYLGVARHKIRVFRKLAGLEVSDGE